MAVSASSAKGVMPTVDYALIASGRRDEFLEQLHRALSDVGFLVLQNAPGLSDEFQQRAFREVREFFDADEEVKLSADIRLSPYYRGWSRATDLGKAPPTNAHGEPRFAQVIEAFQYAFDQPPVAAHDDPTVPIHRRVFRGENSLPVFLPDRVDTSLATWPARSARSTHIHRGISDSSCLLLPFPDCPAACNDPGPNTWPDSAALPGFRPVVKELTSAYHSLTHELGHLICESLGEDPANFDAVSSLVTYVNVSMHHQPLLRRD